MRLGILGGTFNPIHIGHLRIAEEIREELELKKVCIVPVSLPPHKDTKPVTSFHHRSAMIRLATKNTPALETLDLEGRRQGLSYSIETLREIHQLSRTDIDLFFILGLDAFKDIKTWREYKLLFDYSHFVVIKRPGIHFKDPEQFLDSLEVKFKREGQGTSFIGPSGNILIFKEATQIDISSTRIRDMVAAGKSIHFLVPEPVRTYIIEKGLYKAHENAR